LRPGNPVGCLTIKKRFFMKKFIILTIFIFFSSNHSYTMIEGMIEACHAIPVVRTLKNKSSYDLSTVVKHSDKKNKTLVKKGETKLVSSYCGYIYIDIEGKRVYGPRGASLVEVRNKTKGKKINIELRGWWGIIPGKWYEPEVGAS